MNVRAPFVRGVLAWLLSCLALVGCGRARHERSYVVVLPKQLSIAREAFRFAPAVALKHARLDALGQLFVRTDGSDVVVQAPGLCPVTLSAHAKGERVDARLWLDFGPLARAQVGYDAELELRVVPGCDAARNTPIRWRQIEGETLPKLTVSEQGRRVVLRTLPRSHYFGAALPEGIVAVSPRTQGRYVLEATAAADGKAPQTTRITLSSIARATGLSSLAPQQRVMLGTPNLRIQVAPRGSNARVERHGDVDTFMPDVAGRYVLTDGRQRLGLQALPHERTPLDCGRAECHATETAGARDTAMSHALDRLLLRDQQHADDVRCALECHVVGEPGVHDGGFVDVAHDLGLSGLPDTGFSAWPTPLRRLGAVRCTACHGPGAVPEAEGRARILRADVCASCHDAPPAYVHVAQWSRSKMARSDAGERTRTNAACARCHTTGGFLDAIGVRKRADRSRDPDDTVVGISCAACHAAHGPRFDRALMRRAPPAATPARAWNSPTSTLCAQCHTPTPDALVPEASSAALFSGSVTFPVHAGGDVVEGPAPHASTTEGCMACHGARHGEPKLDHSFAVQPDTCQSCHPQGTPRDADAALHEQALALLRMISNACRAPINEPNTPLHALSAEDPCRHRPNLARARYAALLVAEDAAAATHNRPFGLQLLELARQALNAR